MPITDFVERSPSISFNVDNWADYCDSQLLLAICEPDSPQWQRCESIYVKYGYRVVRSCRSRQQLRRTDQSIDLTWLANLSALRVPLRVLWERSRTRYNNRRCTKAGGVLHMRTCPYFASNYAKCSQLLKAQGGGRRHAYAEQSWKSRRTVVSPPEDTAIFLYVR